MADQASERKGISLLRFFDTACKGRCLIGIETSDREGKESKSSPFMVRQCLSRRREEMNERREKWKWVRLDFDLRGFVFLVYLRAHQDMVLARNGDGLGF